MGRIRRKKRVMRLRAIIIGLAVLILAAVVLLGGFRFRSVEIQGNTRHTAEKIQADLIHDFWTENTLYFAWKYNKAVTEARTPYLDSVQAKLLSPGKVRIMVKEKTLTGYVKYGGNNAYFDSNGTVLEITPDVYDGVPVISGVEMEEPVLYQKLLVSNAAQLRTMLSISQLLVKANLIPDNVEFDENQNITLTIGSVAVKMGQDEYLEEKVANLVTIYQELAGENGTLNMSGFTGKNEAITFKKTGETETEAETDAEGNPITTGETDAEGNPITTGETEAGGDAGTTGETDAGGDPVSTEDSEASGETTGLSAFMVFDSSGTLRYDAHVVNGQVVDASGNPIDGCSVNENGNVIDAYMNEIDPATGTLAQ
ncbi:MAG: cell division protein FtsQ/DivIB [Lachnospiraceae bacterium]|nr:cell division protein FtsQ/DivIB [Lachnospiraceae bacterium]